MKISSSVLLPFLLLLGQYGICSQQLYELNGRAIESNGKPIANVLVRLNPSYKSTITDENGEFRFTVVQGEYTISFSHLRFQQTYRQVIVNGATDLEVVLYEQTSVLEDVEIEAEAIDFRIDQHIMRVDPKSVIELPSATGDFSKILATLPGVTSNNELSSLYAVRGGNYDENLIYVNGIRIYRPQIISAGRQEGLSFINPYMAGGISFSAGGWRARYGDKLSSVLDVTYKEPTSFEGVINASMLGGTAYFGNRSDDQSLSYTASIRYKDSRYLLGTLETKGEYLPKFADVQSFVTKRISDRTKISFLTALANNDYLTRPTFQESIFGTAQETLRLSIAFDGQEKLSYVTSQLATDIRHSLTENTIVNLTVSKTLSRERENYDIEAGYLLCEINNVPGSEQFNECIAQRGIGTNYLHGRNRLNADIWSAELRNEVYVGNDLLEFGTSWDMETLDDHLQEYAFIDSADFVTIERSIDNSIDLSSHKISGFAQYTLASADSTDVINVGARFSYWTYSEQLLVSPRMQYTHIFHGIETHAIRVAFGLYSQHPFYRELRDRSGILNPDVKAQNSFHMVAGWDRYFVMWTRPFKMSIDAYHKELWDVNLYDLQNVKIRYFANNDAIAKVNGIDFRLNGEFVSGAESWFSISYLNAQEARNDSAKYVRRPTDQRINIGVFYQDHIPNNPSLRVSLNMLYGSGLPFGPPGQDDRRASLAGDNYFRIDMGFTKRWDVLKSKKYLPSEVIVGLEVLNLLATDNAISYNWIKDTNSAQYAVPNSLSNRWLNLRVIGKF